MSGITEFHRRFEVQVANTIGTISGKDLRGRWEFVLGFNTEDDARAAAERLAEENRWVRVVDRNEENN